MKQFRLSKQSSGPLITKFFVYNSAGDTIGSINVPNEDAGDLERHWLGSAAEPQALALAAAKAATSSKRVIDALVAAKRGAPVAAPARKHENPMIAAMLAAAPRNRLSQQAILRG
jgi:hypothetical protein